MKITLRRCAVIAAFAAAIGASSVSAQTVLFDFNGAPLYSPLPIDLTAGGITAHLSATGPGYSIQDTTAPVVPIGFTGRFIYPSSISAADLLVSFDQTLTYFSILYSPQELGCDDSATMRVTAYMNGNYVGTNTKTASSPGTWPVDALRCNFVQGFNSVVVHYDSAPPTCQDIGTIFLADDMRVLPMTNGVAAFCFGDGSGVACPCGHVSQPARGCGNSNQPDLAGAYLWASGVASISSDTLVLATNGTMPGVPGVYFQGSSVTGVVFGNGIQCASGAMYRLEYTVAINPGVSSTTVPIHAFGADVAGNVRTYQLWYRDGFQLCPYAGFNFTNAVNLTWAP